MENTGKWWQSLPAILTGIAGLIGSLTALYLAIGKAGEAAAPVAPAATDATQQAVVDLTGKWLAPAFTSANNGEINLQKIASQYYQGNYNASDDARIVRGELSGHSLTAYWVENGSRQKCSSRMDNSEYWGRLTLQFDAEFQRFDGWWSYCDNNPTRPFNGVRKR